VFVPPAPADDGNASGAAILSWMETTGTARIQAGNSSAYVGSRPSARTIETLASGRRFARIRHVSLDSAAQAARCLADGQIVGVMRGRAEFGPRALGHRSILANPPGA